MEQPKRRDTQLGLGKGGLVDEDEPAPHATLPSGIVPSAPPGAGAAPSTPPGGTLPPPGSGPHPAVPNTGRPAPPSGRAVSAPPAGAATVPAPPASAPPASGPPASAPPASAPPASQKLPSRQPRSHRPIRVDDVGDTAVRIASKAKRGVVPRVVASPKAVAAAPRDPRDAFVLSMVDGRTSLQAIVDMAGIPEEEVMGILDHLCHSGIIALG